MRSGTLREDTSVGEGEAPTAQAPHEKITNGYAAEVNPKPAASFPEEQLRSAAPGVAATTVPL